MRPRKWAVIQGGEVRYIGLSREEAIDVARGCENKYRGRPYIYTSDGIIEGGVFKPAVDPDYQMSEEVRRNIDEDGSPY